MGDGNHFGLTRGFGVRFKGKGVRGVAGLKFVKSRIITEVLEISQVSLIEGCAQVSLIEGCASLRPLMNTDREASPCPYQEYFCQCNAGIEWGPDVAIGCSYVRLHP